MTDENFSGIGEMLKRVFSGNKMGGNRRSELDEFFSDLNGIEEDIRMFTSDSVCPTADEILEKLQGFNPLNKKNRIFCDNETREKLPVRFRIKLEEFEALLSNQDIIPLKTNEDSDITIGISDKFVFEKIDGGSLQAKWITEGSIPVVIKDGFEESALELMRQIIERDLGLSKLKDELSKLQAEYQQQEYFLTELEKFHKEIITAVFPKFSAAQATILLERTPERNGFTIKVNGEDRTKEFNAGDMALDLPFKLQEQIHETKEGLKKTRTSHELLVERANPLRSNLILNITTICEDLERIYASDDIKPLAITIDPDTDVPCLLAIRKINEKSTDISGQMKHAFIIEHITGKKVADVAEQKALGVEERISEIEGILKDLTEITIENE